MARCWRGSNRRFAPVGGVQPRRRAFDSGRGAGDRRSSWGNLLHVGLRINKFAQLDEVVAVWRCGGGGGCGARGRGARGAGSGTRGCGG